MSDIENAAAAHFVLTRFNLGLDATTVEGDAWLQARVELFERFTKYTMERQTHPPLRWLLLCDAGKGSPDWFRDRISSYGLAWMEPVWLDPGDPGALSECVLYRIPPSFSYAITTRLDNDDAVSRDFCEQIVSNFRSKSEVLNFTRGAQYADGRFYRRLDRSNAFISLVSQINPSFDTIYSARHDQASILAPLRQIRTHPVWLQIIHGSNMNNPVVGIRADPAWVLRSFDLELPSRSSWLELLLGQVSSSLRLAARVVCRPSRLRRAVLVLRGR